MGTPPRPGGTLGQPDDGRQLYVDLEAAGVTVLTGDRATAAAVARTIATELAHSPFATNAEVLVVGEAPGAPRLGDLDRVTTTDSWDDTAPDLLAWAEQSRAALEANGWANAFVARGADADHDALIPLVVVASSPPDDIDVLGAVRAGPTATAVVVVGEPLPDAFLVECQPDQLAVPSLGLTCRPQLVDADDVDAIAQLLDEAENATGEPIGLDLDAVGGNGQAEAADLAGEPYADPEYEVVVRLLGEISVEGGRRPLTAKQTAVVAYIALHGDVSADRLCDAVWTRPAAVSSRKRLANTITKCRAALRSHHLPLATDGRYSVGPGVVTDLELFDQRVAAAAGMPAGLAAETLRGAIELVSGPIFSYPSTEQDSYAWVDVENLVSTWELKIAAVAVRTADLYLDQGDPTAAAEVAALALRALPTHPGLTEALMKAHAASGNRGAVHRVYESHVNALAQLELDDVADSTKTLYDRLRSQSTVT